MVLRKREIEDHQSSFHVLRADTEKLSDNTAELFHEVFKKKFMKKYTRYDSISEFIDDSPGEIHSPESFQSEEFEDFVSENTVFDNWDEMKKKAAENWIVSEIDL